MHGTTIATNALLERRGARTALLTTAGFVDVIEIGRQNRPHLYALHQRRPHPLAPADLRFAAVERLDTAGNVLTPLDEQALARTAAEIAAAAPESLAVCFLYSFRNPQHERRAAQILRRACPSLPISLSSDILPEYREYERTATTVINAYLLPLVGSYLEHLTDTFAELHIRVMQSNGGAIGASQAAQEPARLVLSGPAGGVVGAFRLAQLASDQDKPQIMTFDMGGTSTDVALCPGAAPRTTTESEVAGLPLRLPVIDIHTVGAGGGSLARVDAGGGLRVGPESAGALPGPVCYRRGGQQPTVTDANLALGRLDAGQFLGGSGAMALDVAAAEAALADLGTRLGGLSVPEAALGVVRVANARMERALRRVSVERGHDPRGFTLVPFGGAGPLHACDLADALGIPRILLPPSPGVLSALRPADRRCGPRVLASSVDRGAVPGRAACPLAGQDGRLARAGEDRAGRGGRQRAVAGSLSRPALSRPELRTVRPIDIDIGEARKRRRSESENPTHSSLLVPHSWGCAAGG